MTAAVAILPARGGSSRIPRKNIRPFMGKPIIAYGIDAALSSGIFGRVVVSTEDEEIARIAEGCGAEVIERPDYLADNGVETQVVMQHAVNELDLPAKCEVCCIYPAAPLITVDDLRAAQEQLVSRNCTYVVAVGHQPLRDIGWIYFGHAGTFAYSTELYTSRTGLHVVDEIRAIDINYVEDWNRAEAVYASMHRRKVA